MQKNSKWALAVIVIVIAAAAFVAITRKPKPGGKQTVEKPSGEVSATSQSLNVETPKGEDPTLRDMLGRLPQSSAWPEAFAPRIRQAGEDLAGIVQELGQVARKLQAAKDHAIHSTPELTEAVAGIKAKEQAIEELLAALPGRTALETAAAQADEALTVLQQRVRLLGEIASGKGEKIVSADAVPAPLADVGLTADDLKQAAAGDPAAARKVQSVSREVRKAYAAQARARAEIAAKVEMLGREAKAGDEKIAPLVKELAAARAELRKSVEGRPEVVDLMQARQNLIAQRDEVLAERRRLIDEARRTGAERREQASKGSAAEKAVSTQESKEISNDG